MPEITLKEIADIPNIHINRMRGVAVGIHGTDVIIHLRPLTVGMVIYATAECNTAIETGASMVRLSIERVEGMDAEFETIKIGNREYKCVTLEWARGLVPGMLSALCEATEAISHINQKEKLKLDFTLASE